MADVIVRNTEISERPGRDIERSGTVPLGMTVAVVSAGKYVQNIGRQTCSWG